MNLQIGDAVALKYLPSVIMIVEHIISKDGDRLLDFDYQKITCVWIENGFPRKETFERHMLRNYKEDMTLIQ